MSFRCSNTKNNHIALWTAAALGTVLLFSAVTAASADPTIPAQRRQAEAILAQVQELDAEVGHAAERFNGAQYKLSLVAERLKTTRVDLARGRNQLGRAQGRASERLVQLYVDGGAPSALEVVLGAESLDDVLADLDASERVADQDARIISDIRRFESRTERRERQLASSQARQRELVGRRAAERDAIAARLSERKALLASVQAEVERLEIQERARQVGLRRRAEAELVRQRAFAVSQATRETPAGETSPPVAADPSVSPAPPVEQPPPTPTPVAPPADASKGAQVVAIAMKYLGIPYKWGGASPSTGFDCSGLTMYVFAQVGVSLPHYAAAQYQLGQPVSRSDLQPGDLVFFRGLGHMGMYIGGGNMIHAPRTGDFVKISSLSESYYVATWVGARRVL